MALITPAGDAITSPGWLEPDASRSVHRLLFPSRSVLGAGDIAMTNIRPSSAIERTAVTRTGNGVISLSGPYTGDADTEIDILITAAGGSPRASVPVHTGVGSGAMTDVAALAGATAQTYTITLIDAGTRLTAAEVELEGYTLRAKTAGSDGNDISLTVDNSGLTYTATDFSLLEDLPKDTDEMVGPQWDWDSAAGIGDEVPVAAGRYVIGDDRSVVYRQYRVYEDGAWKYKFLPAIQRDYKAGTPIYMVSGSRSCTLTDGVSPEAYSGVVTLLDLLLQIHGGSALVDVLDLPSSDQTPDNLAAVVDLRLRTAARVDWTNGSGSRWATGFASTSVGSGAKTEIVTARCYSNQPSAGGGALGAELWSLKGSVSGALENVRTNVAYTHPSGRFGLTIPQRLPDGYDPNAHHGTISGRYTPVARENPPQVRLMRAYLGPAATDGTWQLKWTAKPAPTCDPATASIEGGPSEACLGAPIPEEVIEVSTTSPWYVRRREDLFRWLADFVDSNTELGSDGEVRTASNDADLGVLAVAKLRSPLDRLATDENTVLEPPGWTAATAVEEGEQVSDGAGYRWAADSDFTTDATTEPTWTVTPDPGDSVADGGGGNWICLGQIPLGEWDSGFSAMQTDLAALADIGTEDTYESIATRVPSTTYSPGDLLHYAWTDIVTPKASTNDHAYRVLIYNADTDALSNKELEGLSLPPRDGGTFWDGGTLVQDIGPIKDITDDDLNQTSARGTDAGISRSIAEFARRWDALADRVITAAGLDPKASASTAGGSCWQPRDDEYYWEWVSPDRDRPPVYANVYYHTCEYYEDPESGRRLVRPTHEAGFAIAACDVEGLQVDDIFEIVLGGATWDPTYQVGDELYMATISASPLALHGGADGDDTQTWKVDRSIDGIGTAYSQLITAPGLYDDGDLQFRLTTGGVADKVGDYWEVCISAGTFQWQQDGGGWSADLDLGDTLLVDGLTVSFDDGACPSFAEDDTATFDAYQPYAADQALLPDGQALAWTGSSSTLTLSCTGWVDVVVLALHTIPSTATVHISDGAAVDEDLTWQRWAMVLLLSDPLENPTFTITITGAPNGEIGWIGAMLSIEADSDPDAQRRLHRWSMSRGGGVNPSAALLGRGRSAELEWEVAVSERFAEELLEAIDAAKEAGDLPLCLVPHSSLPGEAMLVRVGDVVEQIDRYAFEDADPDERALPLKLVLSPHYV